MTPVPHSIYTIAYKAWISGQCGDDDYTALRTWAWVRWPAGIPRTQETLVFWVISISFQDGHE